MEQMITLKTLVMELISRVKVVLRRYNKPNKNCPRDIVLDYENI